MKITTVLFDLDGTLLPMDQEAFTRRYFALLTRAMAPHGYEPEALMKTVWAGTAAMVKNDGSISNEAAFWNVFAARQGEKARADEPLFAAFYENEFAGARDACGFNPQAAEAVRAVKARGLRTALATNPIFPAVATQSRIRWAGLEPEEFELVTTYENSHFCKPNPAYYREVMQRLGVRPEECVMVGNDTAEDLAAREAGIDVFLVTDCLIDTAGRGLSGCPHGDFAALAAYLDDTRLGTKGSGVL